MARVKMPDGSIVDLPDEAPPEQLAEIDSATGYKEQPSGMGLAARRLGVLSRIPLNAATGTVGAIGDFGAGVAGLFSGKYTPSPIGTEALSKQLNRFYPEAEGFGEKAVDFAGQMAMGKLDVAGAALAKQVGKAAPQVVANFKSPKDQIVELAKELHQKGIKLLPSEGRGSVVGKSLAVLGDEKRIAQQFQIDNQKTLTDAARKATQLNPQIALTHENLVDKASTLADIGYKPVRDLPAIGIGSKYRNELRSIVNELATNPSFPADDKLEVLTAVNKNLYSKVGPDGMPAPKARPLLNWTGDDALKQVQSLRERASSMFKVQGGDKDVPRALNRIATAIEDQVEYQLVRQGKPGVIDQFRQTRADLAKNFAVRRMLSDQYTGMVDPTKAKSIQDSGGLLTGELETIAKAGSPRFAQSTKAPIGKVQPYNEWERNIMLTGFGSTALPGDQFLGPLLAGSIAARPGIRSLVGSKPMQSMMFGERPSLFSPETTRMMQLQAARQFAPLFSSGEQ